MDDERMRAVTAYPTAGARCGKTQRTEPFANPSLRGRTLNCSIAFETEHVSNFSNSSKVLSGTVTGEKFELCIYSVLVCWEQHERTSRYAVPKIHCTSSADRTPYPEHGIFWDYGTVDTSPLNIPPK